MTRFLTILLFLALSVRAGWANDNLDRVRTLLDVGDIEALEAELSSLHEAAQSTGKSTTLREINRRLFATTHPQRRLTIARWHEAYPRSIYAHAAYTWAKIHEALQFSGQYPIDKQPHDNFTRPQWIEISTEAEDLAKAGVKLADNYVGTLDAWLTIRQHRPFRIKDRAGFRRERLRHSATLMGIAPDRDSLRTIIGTAVKSGNPEHDVIEVCLKFANQVPGYTEEICIIEAALKHYIGEEIEAVAQQVRAQLDIPYPDDIWLGYELDAPRENATSDDVEKMKSLLLASLRYDTNMDQFRINSRIIMGRFKQTDFPAVVDGYLLEFLNTVLTDDPFNALHLRVKADILQKRYEISPDDDTLREGRIAWEMAMEHGQFNYRIWEIGARLAAADRGTYEVGVQLEFMHNAIAYSGQGPMVLLNSVYTIHNAREAAQKVLEDMPDSDTSVASETLELTRCPYLRVARLFDAICRTTSLGEAGSCNPEYPIRQMTNNALQLQKKDLCPAVSSTPLSDLRFDPIRYEEVHLPWRQK